MFFIFKKKKLVLDCFTWNNNAYEYAPISNAIEYIPDWWKKTPKQIKFKPEENSEPVDIGTIKSCSGFVEFYKTGIMIPSWFEMEININPLNSEMYWTYSSSDASAMPHGFHHAAAQFQGFAEQNTSNLKIRSPWRLKTNRLVKFLWSSPLWNNKEIIPNLQILPGCLDFYYQYATNINYAVINDESSHTVTITPKMPLAILHPLTEDEIEIKNHLISEKEWENMNNIDLMFLKDSPMKMHRLFKRKKQLIDSSNSKSKCPFGFGKND